MKRSYYNTQPVSKYTKERKGYKKVYLSGDEYNTQIRKRIQKANEKGFGDEKDS
jgi:hypothetical protein